VWKCKPDADSDPYTDSNPNAADFIADSDSDPDANTQSSVIELLQPFELRY
jgi:hypothetical protein